MYLSASMGSKYCRFHSTHAAYDYRFFANQDSFPLISLGSHFDFSEYEGETTNNSPHFWIKQLAEDPNGCYLDLNCWL